MFVVHTKVGKRWLSCDYGHVYIDGLTYHRTVNELLEELGE